MEAGEQVRRNKDVYRNLVRVLNNALQEADTCAGYTIEAEAAGESRLADFFREVQKLHASIVERAEDMLGAKEDEAFSDDPQSSIPIQSDPDPGDVSSAKTLPSR
jgi:hypothetical protein